MLSTQIIQNQLAPSTSTNTALTTEDEKIEQTSSPTPQTLASPKLINSIDEKLNNITIGFSVNYTIPYNELSFDKPIGKGGFSTVYEGTWRDQKVAIKHLKEQTEYARTCFSSEINILTELQKNPPTNAVKYYGRTDQPRANYIVMELVSGGDFFTFIEKNCTNRMHIPWSTCYKLLADITYACIELHDRDIVHGDIKPENVLLTNDERIKLTDFGLAMKLGNAAYKETTYQRGTASYMAPELIKYPYKLSRASDVFALGSIIYIVAGHGAPLQYPGWSDLKITQSVAQGVRSPIRSHCPARLANLIKWCWQHKPEQRPTPHVLLEELNELQKLAEKGDPSACYVAAAKPSVS